MLSKKVELIILNAVLIAGITASGIVTWKSNQTVEAAAAPMVIESEQSLESSSQSYINEATNESSSLEETGPAGTGGGCSNCSGCGQCGLGQSGN